MGYTAFYKLRSVLCINKYMPSVVWSRGWNGAIPALQLRYKRGTALITLIIFERVIIRECGSNFLLASS